MLTAERLRVLSNYARLAAGFGVGLLFVPLMLRLDRDASAAVALLTTGLGIHLLLREVLVSGVTPVLAEAAHCRRPRRLPHVRAAADRVAWAVAGLTLVAYAGVAAAVPRLGVSAEMAAAARWFLLARGAHGVLLVLLAPAMTMYVARGRMVEHNLWLVLERLSELAAIAATLVWFGRSAEAVVAYGVIVSVLQASVAVFAAVRMRRTERCPRHRVSRRGFGYVARSVTSNSLVVLANALYVRVDVLMMSALAGPLATLAFDVATRLSGYVRMATRGLTGGIEAVAAKVAVAPAKAGPGDVGSQTAGPALAGAARLFRVSLWSQAAVVVPLAAGLMLFSGGVLTAWVGPRLAEKELPVGSVAAVLNWMVLAVAFRGLTEGWLRIIAGMGEVDRLLRPTLLMACANPLLVAAWWFVGVEDLAVAAAATFAVSMGVLHLIVIPRAAVRVSGSPLRELVLGGRPEVRQTPAPPRRRAA